LVKETPPPGLGDLGTVPFGGEEQKNKRKQGRGSSRGQKKGLAASGEGPGWFAVQVAALVKARNTDCEESRFKKVWEKVGRFLLRSTFIWGKTFGVSRGNIWVGGENQGRYTIFKISLGEMRGKGKRV